MLVELDTLIEEWQKYEQKTAVEIQDELKPVYDTYNHKFLEDLLGMTRQGLYQYKRKNHINKPMYLHYLKLRTLLNKKGEN